MRRIGLGTNHSNERGVALLGVLVISIMVFSLSFAYLTGSRERGKASGTGSERERALEIGEAGIAVAMEELNGNQDYDGNGIGNVALAPYGGGTYAVKATLLQQAPPTGGVTIYKLVSTGEYSGGKRTIEAIVSKTTVVTSIVGQGAIMNKGSLGTLGNVTIDGRDYALDGRTIVGNGVAGIVSGGSISQGGASKIGGVGVAPGPGAVSPQVMPNNTFPPNGFPASPDAAFGAPEGTLKARAIAQGTYFADAASLSTYLAANGGSLPGGKVFYLAFDLYVPANIGSVMNAEPSILVMHNAAGTATMDNIHGNFKGVILADQVEHINSNTTILGMIMSWAQAGNVYANGTANVDYSSAVLNMLPQITSGRYSVNSWRETP